MKSLQDYIKTYRDIASGLGITGDSSELLIQLLANASYISEVENIAYSQEASLERATTMNSKIQHCIDNMYSVYRGQCPRMILNIKPTKIINWTLYDVIMSSNNFKVYYLGYYDENKGEFSKNMLSYYPLDNSDKTYIIQCILAKDTLTVEQEIKNTNGIYFDVLENDLSNDIKITTTNNELKETTRIFSEHITHRKFFDLTLPGFGSRIYFKDVIESGENKIKVFYFKRSKLSSYNDSELKNISLKGAEITSFEENWLKDNNYTEFMPGKILILETDSDDMLNIHYKANQLRHLNTVFKSNTDLGDLLRQKYPNNIKDTNVIFENTDNNLTIYYIPGKHGKLSENQKEIYYKDYKAYYIVDNINIVPGIVYNIHFDIEITSYETDSVSTQIETILGNFEDKFNVNFLKDTQNLLLRDNSKYSDIETQISKISNVKRINKFDIQYTTESGNIFEEELANDLWNLMIEDLLLGRAYYKISSTIKQIMQ